MKTIYTIAAILFATAASAQTINFDGCEGVKVEGTNYYNLVDPRCKTGIATYQSTGADERRAAAAEAAAEAVED